MGIETKTTIHLTLANGASLELSKAEAVELRDALTAEIGDGTLQRLLRDPDTFRVPSNPWPYPGISPNTEPYRPSTDPYRQPNIMWFSGADCPSFAGTHIGGGPNTYGFRGIQSDKSDTPATLSTWLSSSGASLSTAGLSAGVAADLISGVATGCTDAASMPAGTSFSYTGPASAENQEPACP